MTALTAPFNPVWASRLGGALTPVSEVKVSGGLMEVPLDVISGTVRWNEDQTPHVQASLQCRVPDDQAVLDYLDGRAKRRLIISAGYQVPGSREVHVIADLMLFERDVKRSADASTMDISGVSDEQKIIDADGPLTGSRSYGPGADGGQAIAELIRWAVPDATVVVTASGTFVAAGDSLLIDRDDKFWSSIQDIADRIGAWVYNDGLGTYWVVPQPVNADAATAMFAVGPGGTVTSSESLLSREKWGNTVAVTYSWFDGESRTAFGWAEVTSGPYSVAEAGRKVIPLRIERMGSAAQAQATAAATVRRAVTRGRGLSVQYEHAPLWVRPGQTVTAQLVTGPQARHLVSSVEIKIPEGSGSVHTRQPENVDITTGE